MAFEGPLKAGDAAGAGLGGDPNQPLVPSLAAFAAASGRADIATLATAFENEARRYVGQWTMSARYERGSLLVSVRAGAVPVPRTRVTVLVSGSDSSLAALTGADGVARVPLQASSGPLTAVATTDAPGSPVKHARRIAVYSIIRDTRTPGVAIGIPDRS